MTLFQSFDKKVLTAGSQYSSPISRVALFVVFFWFGLLKVIYMSPAADLVTSLQVKTLPFFGSEFFIVLLGVVEMTIGMSFLVPKITRLAILLLILHMATTFLPLIFLPDIAWQYAFVPTLEGQYIIKNLVLLALAMQIGVNDLSHKKE